MGAKGRAHIVANYTVERMCLDTLHLYSSVLEESEGTGKREPVMAAV
jgi:hypothetical protein